MRNSLILPGVCTVIACLAGCTPVPTARDMYPGHPTELNADCSTLTTNHDLNLAQIEKLEASMAKESAENIAPDIQLTELGHLLGGDSIASPEEMLVLLHEVNKQHEQVLFDNCRPYRSIVLPQKTTADKTDMHNTQVRNRQRSSHGKKD